MIKHWKHLAMGLVLAATTSATAAAQTSNFDTSLQVEGNRSHVVTINRVGQVEGRITASNTGDQASEELNVYFVRDGKIVTQTRTRDGGYFVAENVGEGNYSFVATGNGGFAAYGVQVRPYDNTTSVNAIEAATVSSRYKGLERIVRNSMPSQIATEIVAQGQQDTDVQSLAGSNLVQLSNGQLSGQVVSVEGDAQPVAGTEVFIIQNNREVARTTATRNGGFTVSNLQPGVYDFIAAGSNGIAAIRFQAVDAQSVLSQEDNSSSIIPISFRKTIASAAAASLQVCLTCQGDSGVVGEQIDYAANDAVIVDSVPFDSTAPIEYAGESLGCGCAAGGSCGSCGSYGGAGISRSGGFLGRGGAGGGALLGGGGGGFGRLLGLGGLAGGIVAISDDSDGRPRGVSDSTTD